MFYYTSRVIMAISAFLYPGYKSYKTLSQRPASEQELERWLMYWSVLGCIVSLEYVAEWAISWIPFYYPIKTIFLLYLALPQTEGSSYLYINHLQPFFHVHEEEIDSALASLKWRVYTFMQERVRRLWSHIMATLGKEQDAQFAPVGAPEPNAGNAVPPTTHDPLSGPTQLVSSLWNSYGPIVLATGAAVLRSTQAAAAKRAAQSNATTASVSARPPAGRTDTTQSVEERRRQLQAELEALPTESAMPTAGVSLSVSPSEASLSRRPRTSSSTGKFEEVDVPSDVEGYDMSVGAMSSGSSNEGDDKTKPQQKRQSSWFGWSSPTAAGYERVKSD